MYVLSLLIFVILSSIFCLILWPGINIKLGTGNKRLKKQPKKKEKWREIKDTGPSGIQKLAKGLNDLILQSNIHIKLNELLTISLILGLAGFLIGTMFNYILTELLIAFLFAYIPVAFLKFVTEKNLNAVKQQIEHAVSLIVSTLQYRDDLILSVKDNLNNMEEPVKSYFAEFVNQVDVLGMDFNKSIDELAVKINNPIFDDFVRLAKIYYVKGGNTKYALTDIPEDFKDYKLIAAEINSEISPYVKIGYLFVLLIPLFLVFQRMTNKTYFNILINTNIGKIVVLISIVAGLLSIVLINKAVKKVAQ